MADTQRLINALNAYVGDMDTLNSFVTVAEEELGDRWTEIIYQSMGNLNAGLKEKLDHAFQYNGAVVAWNEAQGYLEQSEVDVDFISERVPILEHWLAFFGEQGTQLVEQVKKRLQEASASASSRNASVLQPMQQAGVVSENSSVEEESENIQPEVENAEKTQNQSVSPAVEDEAILDEMTDKNSAFVADTNILEPTVAQALAEEAQETDQNQETDANQKKFEDEQVSLSASKPVIDESSFVIEEENPAQEAETLQSERAENQDDLGDLSSLLDEDFLNQPLETLKEFVRTSGEQDKDAGKAVVQPSADVSEGNLPQPEVEDTIAQADVVSEVPLDNSAAEQEPDVLPESLVQEGQQETDHPKEEEPDISEDTHVITEKTDGEIQSEEDGDEQNAAWRIHKIKREMEFLDNLEAWVSARCVSLGGIELFSYKYYGFLADVSYVLAEDIKEVLADEEAVQILQQQGSDVLKEIQNKQISLESFVQEVKTKLGSDPIPLLNDEITALEMKKALGAVDESTENEYLGPAPDGFEMLEDPFETNNKKAADLTSADQEAVATLNKMEEDVTDLPVVESVESGEPDNDELPAMPLSDDGMATEGTLNADNEVTTATSVTPAHKKGILGQIEAENEEQKETDV